MDARDRFLNSLAEAVSTAYYSEGDIYLSVERINAIADEQKVRDPERRALLDLLDERGLLRRLEGDWAYGDGIGLLLEYEATESRLAWKRNKLRREILQLAADAYDENTNFLEYLEGKTEFVDAPWAESYAASLTLQHLGLIDVEPFMGHNFHVSITARGREASTATRGSSVAYFQ